MALLQEVEWTLPDDRNEPSREALQALEYAQAAAHDFDTTFSLRTPDRELSMPTFDGQEVVVSADPFRLGSFTAEHELRTVRVIVDLQRGKFGPAAQARKRFAERSIDGHYSVKYLQAGLIDSDHSCNAATELIVETKILMNLAPHPNIIQAYGINSDGIDSFLTAGRRGFFIITDRIVTTLSDRLTQWRDDEIRLTSKKEKNGSTPSSRRERLNQRLEVAMDIASAMVYLHNRKLVYYLRPDKVGFDSRYDRMKLCEFGQSRQVGMASHARSLTKTDDIRVLAYSAPEVFCKGPATASTDVYAFGMILWEFVSLKHPFSGWTRGEHFQRVVRGGVRPPLGKTWPHPVCDLITSCWDPHLRPTMSMVHEHLEMALLFAENENADVKEDFRLSRTKSQPDFSEALKKEAIRSRQNGFTRSQSAIGPLQVPESPMIGGEEEDRRPPMSFETPSSSKGHRRKSSSPRHGGNDMISPRTNVANAAAEAAKVVDSQRKKKKSTIRMISASATTGQTTLNKALLRKKAGGAVKVSESTAAALSILNGSPDGNGKPKRDETVVDELYDDQPYDGHNSMPSLSADSASEEDEMPKHSTGNRNKSRGRAHESSRSRKGRERTPQTATKPDERRRRNKTPKGQRLKDSQSNRKALKRWSSDRKFSDSDLATVDRSMGKVAK